MSDNSLRITRCVLGVVSHFSITSGVLELELGSVLSTELLAIGSDPLFGRSLLVNLIELVLIRSSLVGCLGSGRSEDVSANDTKVIQKLSEFRVGDEESDEYAEVSGS